MRAVAPAFKSGDRLKALRALRDRLAADLDLTTSARDVASLSKQLLDVDVRLAALDHPTEEDGLDSLVPSDGAG